MQSWKEHEIIHQDDDTFIIIKNGLPYHLPNFGEFKKEYAEVIEYIKEHPDQVVEKTIGPTPEEILEQEKQNKIKEFESVISEQKELLIDYCVEMIMQQMMISTMAVDEVNEEHTSETSQDTIELYKAMTYNKKRIEEIRNMMIVEDVQSIKPKTV